MSVVEDIARLVLKCSDDAKSAPETLAFLQSAFPDATRAELIDAVSTILRQVDANLALQLTESAGLLDQPPEALLADSV